MNRLLAIAGILVLAGGLFLLVSPVAHIPLLDANRQVLAETERQGYCAGEVMVQTQGRGSEEAMNECVAVNTIDNEINHDVVQGAFCAGIVANYNIGHGDCMEIVNQQEMWPTMKGTWTVSWNRRFPYPGGGAFVGQQQTGNESRTGDREDTDREGFER